MTPSSIVPLGARKKQKHDEDKTVEQDSDLENLLRQQKIESMTESKGNGNPPIDQQKHDISKYVHQDGLVHKCSNELGNYTDVASQISRLNVDHIRAMDVSTLDSKHALYKIDQLNNSTVGQMFANQHGVMHASRKSLKRQAQIHKLSASESWI